MTRLTEAQYLQAMPLLKIHAPLVVPVANAGVVNVGVWPVGETTGVKRADVVMIRPSANVRMAIDETPHSTSALLAADVEYVFPLHPTVNSLGFFSVAASTLVQVRWMVIR